MTTSTLTSIVMLGRDWPVSMLAGGYARVWGSCPDWSTSSARDAIRDGTAVACYGLSGSGQEIG
jgi:predicted TIM-barrel fold metal-dependent hydrolase